MTLMIGTSELAERLYSAWRRRQDLLNPVSEELPPFRDEDGLLVTPQRDRPRPKWEHLDTLQQDVWKTVAEEAARTLVDAMGAA